MVSVYVGTYKKYNSGSVLGCWLDLENYTDKEDFLTACKSCHFDESDPEFFFMDWVGIPDVWISNSYIMKDVWNSGFLDRKSTEQEAFTLWSNKYNEESIDKFDEAYVGHFLEDKDIDEFFEDIFLEMAQVPQDLMFYIDIEQFRNDLLCNGDYDLITSPNYGGEYLFSQI